MRNAQIEAVVLDAIDRVAKGQFVEDARIELKSEWPADHQKAARRVAAHCNAAAGDTVIWIVGLDEKRGAIGCNQEDCARWWPMVASHFADNPPRLLGPIRVSATPQPVVAMGFSTDDVPYVVKATGGLVELEIPWREGTRTRSARRQEVIRMFGRRLRVPKLEIVDSSLEPVRSALQHLDSPIEHVLQYWRLRAEIAVLPEPGTTYRYLVHRSTVVVDLDTPLPSGHRPILEFKKPRRRGAREEDGVGLRLDGSIMEFDRAVTVQIVIKLEFQQYVRQLRSSECVVSLAPATDEPGLEVRIPASQSKFYGT